MKKSNCCSAFTLVELLVVLAVIAILAAILFPVFGKARESARAAVCVKNQAQVGLATLLYVQDYDENFPTQSYHPFAVSPINGVMAYAPEDGRLDSTWMSGIFPYHKTIEIGICPRASESLTFPQKPTAYSRTSYAHNGLLGNLLQEDRPVEPEPVPVARLSGVARPAECMLFQDQGVTWSRSQPVPRWNAFFSEAWCSALSGGLFRGHHNNGFFMTFVDGHTKRVTGPEAARGLYDIDAGQLRFCLGNARSQPPAKDRESLYNPYKP